MDMNDYKKEMYDKLDVNGLEYYYDVLSDELQQLECELEGEEAPVMIKKYNEQIDTCMTELDYIRKKLDYEY